MRRQFAVGSQPAIRFGLWDIGNVLVKARHSLAHEALREKHGLKQVQAEHFFTVPAYADFARGKVTGLQYATAVNVAMGTNLTEAEIRAIHDCHLYGVDEKVVDVLRRMNEKVAIGFATTTNPWQSERQEKLIQLRKLSMLFFASDEMGERKEEGFDKIADAITGWHQINRSEILLIDDSETSVAMAKRCGLSAYQFVGAEALQEEMTRLGLID